MQEALSYNENIELIRRVQCGDATALDRITEINMPLVRKLAYKFSGRGVDGEDLLQIGAIGLLRAARTFDISRNTAFSTYAVPLIIGEIRRYLRDDGTVKVSRTLKKNAAIIMHENEQIFKETGELPTLACLAERCRMTIEEVSEALEAASPIQSFSDELGGDGELCLGDIIPAADTIAPTLELIALRESLASLPPLWRKIVMLRYYRELSQKETANLLGLTQVKISREEKKIFAALREKLGGA